MKTGHKVRIINGLREDEWALIEWMRENRVNPSLVLIMLAIADAEEREANES